MNRVIQFRQSFQALKLLPPSISHADMQIYHTVYTVRVYRAAHSFNIASLSELDSRPFFAASKKLRGTCRVVKNGSGQTVVRESERKRKRKRD